MAVTIGVVLYPDRVEATKVDGGEVRWSAIVPVIQTATVSSVTADVVTIADALSTALAQARVPRWPSPRVHVAIAEPFARTKVVRGTPVLRKRRELLAMLRLNVTQYVASGTPVLLTGARELGPSEVEVGIADLHLVHAAIEVVERAKLRIGFVVPAVVLERGPGSSSSPARLGADEHQPLPERIARLGRSELLALPHTDNPARVQVPVSRLRRTMAYVALAVAAVSGSYIHVIQTNGRIAALQAAERRVAPSADSATSDLRELGGLNHSIGVVAEFSRQRVSATLLLAALADALPAGVAVTTIRMDTATVDIVTLAPRTAAVIDALTEMPEVEAPAILGPVSRDAVGAATLERATIRMRLARGDAHGTERFAVEREDSRE